MTAIPHILTLYSATWIPWLLLLGLVLMALCLYLYPKVLQNCFYSYISHAQRAFTQRVIKWEEYVPAVLFKVITLSLILYIWVTMGEASFRLYAWFCVITASYLLLRKLCFLVVNYVFDLQFSKLPSLSSFNQLGLVLCFALFPLAIVAMHMGVNMVIQSIILLLVGIYIILFAIKAAVAFLKDGWMLILLILYLWTIIILPAGGAIVMAQYIS